MKISEQPGRYFAIFILSPFFIILSYLLYNNHISNKTVSKILLSFAICFFFYESFWVLKYKPKEIHIIQESPATLI